MASVQGSRAKPYKVTVRVRTYSDQEWDGHADGAGQPGRPHGRPARRGDAAGSGRRPGRRQHRPVAGGRRATAALLVPGLGQPLQALRRRVLPGGRHAGRRPVPFVPHAGPGAGHPAGGTAGQESGGRAAAGGGASPGSGRRPRARARPAPTVAEQATSWARDTGVAAREAWARWAAANRPGRTAAPGHPLPPPKPGRPTVLAVDPPPGSGLTSARCCSLAADAVQRAWELAHGETAVEIYSGDAIKATKS